MEDSAGKTDGVVRSFSVPWITAVYVAAMALLGLHLRHGAVSLLQTMGLGNPTWAPLARAAALLLVAGLIAGNIAIPLLIQFGATAAPGGAP